MRLARVAGTVVSARKDERLDGSKLLVTRLMGVDGVESTDEVIAIDTVGAGEGEVVIIAVGSAARRAVGHDDAPTDAAVVGIVDQWDADGAHHVAP